MLLLIWGAYARRTGAVFNIAAVAILIAAAAAAANGPLGRAFAGGLVADGMAVFAKVTIYRPARSPSRSATAGSASAAWRASSSRCWSCWRRLAWA
jgi:hypothetical protein